MSDTGKFTVTLTRKAGFEFAADFALPGVPALHLDEPAPLGGGTGPNPARVLAAAIGDCLSASLLYCLQRARIPVDGITTSVEGEMVRNAAGRLRMGPMRIRVAPEIAGDQDRIGRCLEIFEDFCVVTQSVRDGMDVSVAVEPVAPVEATRP